MCTAAGESAAGAGEAAAAGASGVSDRFRLGPAVVEALASIPAGFAGIFGGFADPIGAGIVSGDEETVAEEVGADAGVFGTLRSRFKGSSAGAYAYLLFILIYFPCIAALGAIVREIGRGFGWLSVIYLTVLGWIAATLFYQIAVARQVLWIVIPLVMIGAIVAFFSLLGRRKPVG